MSQRALGQQFTVPANLARRDSEYPVKDRWTTPGGRPDTDKAMSRATRTGHYDARLVAHRQGITPSVN